MVVLLSHNNLFFGVKSVCSRKMEFCLLITILTVLNFTVIKATPEELEVLVKTEELQPIMQLMKNISEDALPDGDLKQQNISDTLYRLGNLLENERNIPLLITSIQSAVSSITSGIFGTVNQLFTGVFINILRIIKNVFLGNLLVLFATLNNITYLWRLPNLYIPLLMIYVGFLIADGALYLVINAFSNDPDNLLEVLGTFWGGFLNFLWSFLPF